MREGDTKREILLHRVWCLLGSPVLFPLLILINKIYEPCHSHLVSSRWCLWYPVLHVFPFSLNLILAWALYSTLSFVLHTEDSWEHCQYLCTYISITIFINNVILIYHVHIIPLYGWRQAAGLCWMVMVPSSKGSSMLQMPRWLTNSISWHLFKFILSLHKYRVLFLCDIQQIKSPKLSKHESQNHLQFTIIRLIFEVILL